MNVYKSASSEDLDNLAEADRFLVECLKIYRLRPRIDGMLYRARFDESFETLQKVRLSLSRCSGRNTDVLDE